MEFDPSAYWKPRGQWWDGYQGQKVVIIDEFFGWLPWDELLKVCDRYPLNVERKGSVSLFVAGTVIITTNKPPHQWYDGRKCPFRALERRVDEWHYYRVRGTPPTVYTGDSGYTRMMQHDNHPDFVIDPKFD